MKSMSSVLAVKRKMVDISNDSAEDSDSSVSPSLSLINMMTTITSETTSQSNKPPNKYGARYCREDYTPDTLKVAAILNKSLQRACNSWSRSKDNGRSRGQDSFASLLQSCQQAANNDLNFSQYFPSLWPLVDIYSITPSNISSARTNDVGSRTKYINLLIIQIFNKLSPTVMSDSSNDSHLLALINSIHELPDHY